ncbi:MAG: hypothetical protein Q7J31_10300 [Syntrophales bacterium]|nr:hypothetical protein [Syntrophales bacterium]
MSTEYEIHKSYVNLFAKQIDAKEQVTCEVVSQDDFLRHLVRANISRSIEALPKGQKLWLRDDGSGLLDKDPYSIEILEELDPDEVTFIPGKGVGGDIYGAR